MPARKTKPHARTYERTDEGQHRHHADRVRRAASRVRSFQPDAVRRRAARRFYNVPTKSEFDGLLFATDRFSFRVGKFGKHELALNPDGFIDQTDEQIVRRWCTRWSHVWQHAHRQARSARLSQQGMGREDEGDRLAADHTGMVGGKETGQRMTHYIIPDAAFITAFAKLAATGWKLNLQSAHHAGGKKAPNSKVKFTCPSCAQNAWGKPDLAITCTPCGLDMLAERAAADADAMPAPSYEPELTWRSIRQRRRCRRSASAGGRRAQEQAEGGDASHRTMKAAAQEQAR